MTQIDKDFPLISSLQNPRVKDAVKLRQRRDRDRAKLFLIEGFRELLRAADGKASIATLFICPELFLGENEWGLIERLLQAGAEVFQCPRNVFEKLSYRDRPDGMLAVAPHLNYSLQDLELALQGKEDPFLVVAEAIEKPGNLGTILRSADAVGADAVIICDRCTDIHNPNVVRASVGTLFTRPVVESAGEEVMDFLQRRGVKIVAATPAASCEYTQADLTGPVAIAVGTEQYGLSERWMDGEHLRVVIPMCGVADSLNVAMATSLLLYEVLRQRG